MEMATRRQAIIDVAITFGGLALGSNRGWGRNRRRDFSSAMHRILGFDVEVRQGTR
jgi:hypothetical protein